MSQDLQALARELDSIPDDPKQLTPDQWKKILETIRTILMIILGGSQQGSAAATCCACQHALKHILRGAAILSECCCAAPEQPAGR